ncbi:MAG: NAD(P)/FAD-dependent oxidoreductase [Clostridia bacterium]|nr:NAD(P)/FAD-dependent oxidoreductase [Clostridia bacterium]
METLNYDIAVIGAGAAGLMSALVAGRQFKRVCLIEKNEKAGKKIYITGKGRCNLTNLCAPRDFLDCVVNNSKFLMGSLFSFPPEETVKFFESLGLKQKTERGNRVFPLSDKASDVTKALVSNLDADFFTERRVVGVDKDGDEFCIDLDYNGLSQKITAKKVIIATGGITYPSTGSTGDGYAFAKKFGHKIIPPIPALTALHIKENVKDLQGLSLKNVTAKVAGYSEFGEMLFTSNGVSGPIILTLSSKINRKQFPQKISIDLKPALSKEQLDDRILRDFSLDLNKAIKNILPTLLPKSLIVTVLDRARIDASKPVNSITKEERARLVDALKNLEFTVTSLAPKEEAIITAGGVDVSQVNPSTMESKLVKGLYFAGEVLNIDAETGGYNLQIAWSTGYKAGLCAAKEV